MAKAFAPGEAPIVVNGTCWTMLSISTIFLGLRLYSRLSRSKSLWWDDYMLILSTALLIVSMSFLTKAMSVGYLDFDPTSLASVFNWRVSQTYQIVSLALAKVSFGLTLMRFSSRWQKGLLWFIVASVGLVFAAHAFALWIGPCNHILPYDHVPGICWSPTSTIIVNITVAMYSALTDFIMAILPWKVLLGLNMKKAEKISIGFAMSVGVIAGVTGLMKGIQSIITIDYTKPSFAYDIVLFWIFMMAEPNATIVAASSPSLRGLIHNIRTNKSSERYDNNLPRTVGYPWSAASKLTGRPKRSIIELTVTEHDANDSSSDKSILGRPRATGELQEHCDAETREETMDSQEMHPPAPTARRQ